MKAQIKFDYYGLGHDKDQAERLTAFVKQFGIELEFAEEKEYPEKHKAFRKKLDEYYLLDLLEVAKGGFKFEVKPVDKDVEANILSQMASILSQIKREVNTPMNQHVSIKFEQSHDAFLTRVNDVKVCEEYCTDELRREINEGWRIIAVCPQKGNRRPDYVLGRENAAQ